VLLDYNVTLDGNAPFYRKENTSVTLYRNSLFFGKEDTSGSPLVVGRGCVPSAPPSHDSSCEDLSGIDVFFGDTIGFKKCNWLSGRKADMATFCVPTHRYVVLAPNLSHTTMLSPCN